ncbi:hypothetical protein FA15DRAFT_658028 [Coprinopsis marcescibilis]|uniref:Uncharacterized protein n=1 Tax=Coprinopsis marcescibilis TaxID=230819 RepID=A0A5C3KNG0_COPMA|nr:hypothetical protein FA15DRAFT_658028 [Coprinopsis marcescibilis]
MARAQCSLDASLGPVYATDLTIANSIDTDKTLNLEESSMGASGATRRATSSSSSTSAHPTALHCQWTSFRVQFGFGCLLGHHQYNLNDQCMAIEAFFASKQQAGRSGCQFGNPECIQYFPSINVNDPSVQSFLRTSFNSAFSMTPYTVPAAKPHPPNEEDSDDDNTSVAPPPMPPHSTVHCARENESWFSELMSTILRNMALGFLLRSVLSSNINNSQDFVSFIMCQVFQAQPVVHAIYNRLGLDFKDWNSTWDQNAQDLSLPAWQISYPSSLHRKLTTKLYSKLEERFKRYQLLNMIGFNLEQVIRILKTQNFFPDLQQFSAEGPEQLFRNSLLFLGILVGATCTGITLALNPRVRISSHSKNTSRSHCVTASMASV